MLIFLFICQFLKKMFAARKSGEYFQFRLKSPGMFAAVCAKIVGLDFFFIPNINISYFKEQHINLEKSETITKKIYKCYLCLWKNCITVTESDCVTLPYCMKIKS